MEPCEDCGATGKTHRTTQCMYHPGGVDPQPDPRFVRVKQTAAPAPRGAITPVAPVGRPRQAYRTQAIFMIEPALLEDAKRAAREQNLSFAAWLRHLIEIGVREAF